LIRESLAPLRDDMTVVSEELRIPSDTPGIELSLHHKRPRSATTFGAERTIVMVHGATYSSGSLYDVPLGGFSFLDYLADGGYDVYALDVRGYGGSSRPHEMEEPGDRNPPRIDTAIGVRDLATAVDNVLTRNRLSKLNVFGMSWGGAVAGAYVSRNCDKVNKLVVLAPLWLSDRAIPLDTGDALNCYRLVPVLESKARWLNTAPSRGRRDLIPEGWFDQWAKMTLAEDPWSETVAPQMLRATNGPIQDIRDYWTVNRKFYEPRDITVPVLLVHGEWDVDVPLEVARSFYSELINAPYRRWVEIGEATHMLLLEKNRLQAFKAIRDFYGETFTPAG
jgi:pimeloyl-ACP methyl ester carboxylesterase